MGKFTLYHTEGCHLCEEAENLVIQYFDAQRIPRDHLELEDIAENEELLERYGVRIPVLREHESGRELNWPFDLQAIGATFYGGGPLAAGPMPSRPVQGT